MLRLDVSRFQPGYQKPEPPAYTNADFIEKANRIMDRVESAAERFGVFGEGSAFGDTVQISLKDHEVRNGLKLKGNLLADSKSGELESMRAEVYRDGGAAHKLSYDKDSSGRETYTDTHYGKVVKSREGASLYTPQGEFLSKLY